MHSDIAIIGAGPAGSVSAALLARQGFNVLIIDRPEFEDHKVGESLPSAINSLLWSLQLKPLEKQNHCPIYGTDSLWAGDRIQQDSLAEAQGSGWRINRKRFEQKLFIQAVESGAHHCSARLTDATREDQTWLLKTDDGKLVKSHFVIDASGRSAVFARKRGVARIKAPPLIALWSLSSPQRKTHTINGQTLIESQKDGWWYAAQLPDRRWLAIFHTSPEYAKIMRNRTEFWHQQLISTEMISDSIPLPDFITSELYANDAREMFLRQPYGQQWTACGDSALSFDPISSQGIFNAVASADMLSRALNADDQEAGLKRYHQKLEKIADIYRQRRDWFYRRAYQVYQSRFWSEQLSVPCSETELF